ncbi:hypothetical protein HYT84_01920 [Candidatus Micrarchaeota archaeon]|nr:hypothetical protein [Candidatus Micrarchaeota archaeon]
MSMSLALVRAGTFGELPHYRPKQGKRPNRLILIAPHTNENGVAVPFRDALTKRLENEGVTTIRLSVLDLMERCWRLRKQLDPNTDFNQNAIVSAVLQLEDLLIRARLISTFLTRYPGSMVVEVHGNKKHNDEDQFFSEYPARRIRGTSIITVNDLIADVFNFFQREDYAIIKDDITAASLIALLRGFDIVRALEEFAGLLKNLRATPERQTRIRFIGVPGEEFSLPISHPIYFDYHDCLAPKKVSNFEDSYAVKTVENPGFTEADIEKVASTLVL